MATRGGEALRSCRDTNSGLIDIDEEVPAFNAGNGWIRGLEAAGWTDAFARQGQRARLHVVLTEWRQWLSDRSGLREPAAPAPPRGCLVRMGVASSGAATGRDGMLSAIMPLSWSTSRAERSIGAASG